MYYIYVTLYYIIASPRAQRRRRTLERPVYNPFIKLSLHDIFEYYITFSNYHLSIFVQDLQVAFESIFRLCSIAAPVAVKAGATLVGGANRRGIYQAWRQNASTSLFVVLRQQSDFEF